MDNEKKCIEIYTDGACKGNPGPGGWAVLLRFGTYTKELCGGNPDTTNNRMELTAIAEGLKALKEPCVVTLYSDSQYCVNAILKGWAQKWKFNNWMRNKKEKALNPDLWDIVLDMCSKHEVTPVWIKGHSGHPENERCDSIAVTMAERYANVC